MPIIADRPMIASGRIRHSADGARKTCVTSLLSDSMVWGLITRTLTIKDSLCDEWFILEMTEVRIVPVFIFGIG